ncbi:MAG: glutamate--cysteine ligase [SAR86 cluster bacterium]|uniref:Glutamate--cysteine ligase n=1 Tax=SAR86 cluster bacterium TaxID=2030880 RepID=A0A2A4MSK2_9GAMM|nr:MAG: glutamate--cysteine ligase [SAR86 cluster bacterium]
MQRFQLPSFEKSWSDLQRGIEKESLRITPEGYISQASHPLALGSALTNPFITTDFSEALLEFITPVYSDIDECLKVLEDIHSFTYQHLQHDEYLWVASMPCPMGSDEEIPLAQYGNSNIGKLKTLYRQGLSKRYGSLMQTIAGLHYNFSMPDVFWDDYQKVCQHQGSLQDFRTEKYLHLIRNFRRYSWLLIYLFGASPASCKCFVQGRSHSLQELDKHSLYLPNATCLRMGNLGYKSEAQESLFVCYNELDSYVECLKGAMNTSYPAYEEISNSSQQHVQLNSNLLQLENEFYSTIRPKRTAKNGETPLAALTREGIEYIEVRALDLNPMLPLGIDSQQANFIDAFLVYCLLSESPVCNEKEFFEVESNINLVVEQGRDPNLKLSLEGQQISLKTWADSLLEDIEHSASLLDNGQQQSHYNDAIAAQKLKVADPQLTPSGQMLKIMQEQELTFYEFSVQQSQQHKAHFLKRPLDSETSQLFEQTSADSRLKQSQIEASDTMSFDEFLAQTNRR